MSVGSSLKAVGSWALDLVLPPRCPGCGVVVGAQGALCPACWGRLTFLGPPWCARCGMPFDLEPDPDAAHTLCAGCIAAPPPFERARSAVAYDAGSRDLLLGFKHGDRTWAVSAYGGWLARAGGDLLADADLLVAVPLHRWRLFRRRYNQAALLAAAAGRIAGVPVRSDLLVRRRATPPQGGLGREGRRRNVAGAIAVRRGLAPLVEGRRVVLVDDVYTTGATVGECAKVLRRAGAAAVGVLTLARVLTTGE